MVDFDSLPEDAAPSTAPTPMPTQSSGPTPAPSPSAPAAPSFDALPDDSQTKATPGEQFITGAEGIARGILSAPVATGIEQTLSGLGVPDLTNADINARAQTNPGILAANEAAGTIGSFAVPVVGEGLLLAKASAAAEEALNAGKYGSMVIRGLFPAVAITGGDEISKAMTGLSDPETPVASSLLNIGASGLLGVATEGALGGISSGLKSIASSKMGERASQAVADFSSQWKILSKVKNMSAAVYDELSGIHNIIRDSMGEVHGSGGIKDMVVEKLSPQASADAVAQHVSDIADAIEKLPSHLKDDPTVQEAIEKWRQRVGLNVPTNAELQSNRFFNSPNIPGSISDVRLETPSGELPSLSNLKYTPPQETMIPGALNAPAAPSSGDVFNATDSLKKDIGDLVFGGQQFPPRSELPFLNAGNKFYGVLKSSLEDQSTWGKLGKFQSDYNKAFSQFQLAAQDFKIFTKNLKGERVVDFGKVDSMVKGILSGKPNSDLPSQYIENYVNHGQDLIHEINSLWQENGVPAPFDAMPISATKGLFGELTTGTKLANTLYNPFGSNKYASPLAGAIIGANLGSSAGLPGEIAAGTLGAALSPVLEEITGRIGNKAVRKAIVPVAMKALSSGAADKIFTAIDHAGNMAGGLQMTNSAIDRLFKGAGPQIVNYADLVKKRDKTKNFVDDGGVQQQIQNQQNSAPNPAPTLPWQTFSEGGMVQPQLAPELPSSKPKAQESLAPVLEGTRGFSELFPDQNMMMQAARARVSGYLANQKPQPNLLKLPFDRDISDQAKSRNYDQVIDLANAPIKILDDVKDGTLTPQTLKHFVSMYPEVHSFLCKKILERVTKAQMENESPKYSTRQAMSMFLGMPLDSSMTPQSIQATQAIYAQQGPSQPQPQTKPKRNTSKMGKIAENDQTPDQARQQRAMKS